MQTFLPFPSYYASAVALDNKRLGKQRVEAMQLLNALNGRSKGWVNHPAAKMWQGYTTSLVHYGLMVCLVWKKDRGFKDTCFGKIRLNEPELTMDEIVLSPRPPWWGDPDFHRSHQSNLIRKDPEWYGPRFPNVPDDLDYVWPIP